MPIDTIEGKWAGHFTYGAAYSLEKQTKSVSFVIELWLDENGLLKGTCSDELTAELLLGPATIEGSFENDFVTFTKRYPCFIGIDENSKTISVPDKPSVGVHYKGTLRKKIFSAKYYFKGDWEISGSFLDKNGNAQYYTFEGGWSMKKSG